MSCCRNVLKLLNLDTLRLAIPYLDLTINGGEIVIVCGRKAVVRLFLHVTN